MAVTQTYCDFGTGNDYNGASFTDGAFTVADMTLTKAGAFVKSKVNHWLYLTDDGSGRVTPGYYKIASVTSNDAVVLATSPKSGATDPIDVKCTQATGTVLLPFRSIQGALDIITRDATNGDQINIKSTTAQVNAAALTLVTYGTPVIGAPLIFRGYTTSLNDGGVAEINANGVALFAATTYNALIFVDLQIHSFGDNHGVSLSSNCIIYRCNIHRGVSSPSSKYLIQIGGQYVVVACSYVHSPGTNGICIRPSTSLIVYNYILADAAGSVGINGVGQGNTIANNIIKCTNATAKGIETTTGTAHIFGNTVYSSASGTGEGINIGNGASRFSDFCMNNVVEGWSGVGGLGIGSDTAGIYAYLVGNNAFYNNTGTYSIAGNIFIDETARDITLLASPFTNPAGANFAVSTALKALGYPASFNGASTNTYIDVGAAQRQEPAGGAVSISPSLGSVGAA